MIKGDTDDRRGMLLADQYEHSCLIHGAYRNALKKDQIHSAQGVSIPVDNTFPENDGTGRDQQSVQSYDACLQIYD